jgi:hypothetical protein
MATKREIGAAGRRQKTPHIDAALAARLLVQAEAIALLSLSNRNLLRDDRPDQARIEGVIHQLAAEIADMLQKAVDNE